MDWEGMGKPCSVQDLPWVSQVCRRCPSLRATFQNTERTRMKTTDLIDLMAILPQKFKVNENGEIRDQEGFCPVCALVKEIYGSNHPIPYDDDVGALHLLFPSGISSRLCTAVCDIAFAADH